MNRWPTQRWVVAMVLVAALFAASCAPTETVESSTGGTEDSERGEGTNTTTGPCLTVPTTEPGDVFCDGYTPPFDEPPAPVGCPSWASQTITRPADGWLGTESTGPTEDLFRSELDTNFEDPESLDKLLTAVTTLAPAGFSVESSDVWAAPECIESTRLIQAYLTDDEGAQIRILFTPMKGQLDWFYVKPSGEIVRTDLDDGGELMTGQTPDESTVRAWVASPDGLFVRVTAYGANADTYAGYPTTGAPLPTEVGDTMPPVGKAPLTQDQAAAMAKAVLAS